MNLRATPPAELGLDADRLEVACSHVAAGVEAGTYTGAVLQVTRHGQTALLRPFGGLGHGGAHVTSHTVFDLASVTKPLVACALLTLVEDGKLSLAQPLEEVLNAAAGSPAARVSVRELATHVSGLPPWLALYEPRPGRDAMLCRILQTNLEADAGARYAYSDLGYMLLGEVVAQAGGAPLDKVVRDRVFRPAGMADTTYLPPASEHPMIAATANCPMRPDRLLVGEVHDANAHAYGGVAGHAGVFGTAPDVAAFASALATDGTVAGCRVLGRPALRLVRTNQVDPGVGGHSIGWFTPPNSMLPRGDILGDAAFGHTGFTGTMVVVEPELRLAVVLLTNRVVNPADASCMAGIRRRTLNAVASAVVGP